MKTLPPKPFMDMKEASNYLGISINTLYLYNQRKLIPFYKPTGRKIYFKISDLNNFITMGGMK